MLFEGCENVFFVQSHESCAIPVEWLQLGVEMLVMSGGLTMVESTGEVYYGEGSWLRFPGRSDKRFTVDIMAEKNTQLWIKTGHLPEMLIVGGDNE